MLAAHFSHPSSGEVCSAIARSSNLCQTRLIPTLAARGKPLACKAPSAQFLVAMRPIWPLEENFPSVNQRFPSGPAGMPKGEPLGSENSVNLSARLGVSLGVDVAVWGVGTCESHAATMTTAVTRSAVSILFFITCSMLAVSETSR